jgi:hypothetical protein
MSIIRRALPDEHPREPSSGGLAAPPSSAAENWPEDGMVRVTVRCTRRIQD